MIKQSIPSRLFSRRVKKRAKLIIIIRYFQILMMQHIFRLHFLIQLREKLDLTFRLNKLTKAFFFLLENILKLHHRNRA